MLLPPAFHNTVCVGKGIEHLLIPNSCGNKSVVQLLLQYDANVNTRDASSLCPLHLAAMRGHDRVIALLLQEHIKIDEPGPNEETPLRIAAEKGYMKCVELLLQARAKVNTNAATRGSGQRRRSHGWAADKKWRAHGSQGWRAHDAASRGM